MLPIPDSSQWSQWLAPTSGSPAVRCPRCQHYAAPSWLPSRRRHELWWSLCAQCDGIAIWRSGRLEQPCDAEEVLPREVRRELVVRFVAHAPLPQRAVIDALSEARSRLLTDEGYLGEVSGFLTAFMQYAHGLRRSSPVADRSSEGPEPDREGQSTMSDDRVLQAAQSDEATTQRRIEELREEIERSEARLQTISDFISKYREYENVAQPVTAGY